MKRSIISATGMMIDMTMRLFMRAARPKNNIGLPAGVSTMTNMDRIDMAEKTGMSVISKAGMKSMRSAANTIATID